MKLIRFGETGKEKPGIYRNDSLYDVSGFIKDYDELFLANNGLQNLAEIVEQQKNNLPKLNASTRLGPPIARPSKIICIGLNYAKHAAESGMAAPTEPVIFFKSTTALCGPNDSLIIPKNSTKTDWEVELAVIIGKKTSYITIDEAMENVAGYAVHNDYSERAFQLERGGQWVKGKSCDSFAPLGPWLVTKDEIPDPNSLHLWLKVNGRQMQNSSTADFIFNIPFIVSYLSQFMTLLPGDMISTGTPEGVGLGQKPHPIYIKAGDIIELGIDGLGTQKQIAKDYSD
jgi:2,4-didehydro-3-deoxy-L-rhamnonate hydrolase